MSGGAEVGRKKAKVSNIEVLYLLGGGFFLFFVFCEFPLREFTFFVSLMLAFPCCVAFPGCPAEAPFLRMPRGFVAAGFFAFPGDDFFIAEAPFCFCCFVAPRCLFFGLAMVICAVRATSCLIEFKSCWNLFCWLFILRQMKSFRRAGSAEGSVSMEVAACLVASPSRKMRDCLVIVQSIAWLR